MPDREMVLDPTDVAYADHADDTVDTGDDDDTGAREVSGVLGYGYPDLAGLPGPRPAATPYPAGPRAAVPYAAAAARVQGLGDYGS